MLGRRPYALFFAATLLVSGCSLKHPATSLKKVVGVTPAIDVVGHITPEANTDSVIPFDLVLIYDKKDAEKIGQMDANAWFGDKGRCNYREGPKAPVQFHSWEFVPGQNFHLHLALNEKPRKIYGFALYESTGKHRIELTGKSLLLHFGADGIEQPTTNLSPEKDAPAAQEKLKVCADD